ncbi:MAG: hypothetical protein IV112_03115 [Methyloversatilis discipulorum]|uniref:hypothetical protein n=1 Tax=Methyloversatilis discipulorum TaxID=1119528 RepID=UPI0026F324CB|nr:hypothetical protein [Methyloversatilis discipulorum]MBT9515656.1 hypothetical protein [Methyloversatilis discipulorum]
MNLFMHISVDFKRRIKSLFIVVLTAGCASLVVTPLRAEDSSFMLGIAGSINDPSAAWIAAKGIGAMSVRLDAPWAQIERRKGEYQIPPRLMRAIDDIKSNGQEPLLILAYGNPLYGGDKPKAREAIEAFAKYSEWLVKALDGKVRYFQLWNEWETKVGGTTPGSADDYVSFAKVVVPVIRKASPQVVLLSNGISYPGFKDGWIERFLQLGGAALFDGIALHPYVWHVRADWRPEASIQMVDAIHEKAVAAGGGAPVNIFITEIGYPTFEGELGTSEQSAAWYLTRFVLLSYSRPWIKGIWWYGIRDQGSDSREKEHRFGVFSHDMQPKPASFAFRKAAELVSSDVRGKIENVEDLYTYKSTNGLYEVTWKSSKPTLGKLSSFIQRSSDDSSGRPVVIERKSPK